MTKLIPNSFQHPNVLVDQLAHFLTPEENVVLTKAVREILGWHNKIEQRRAAISLSVFLDGKLNSDGERLCYGCGLGIQAIRNALNSLNEYGILIKTGKPTQDGQSYWLQDSNKQIRWGALSTRLEKKEAKNKNRTNKATAKSLISRGVTSDVRGNVGRKGGVTSDVRLGVTSDVNKETHIETQKETQKDANKKKLSSSDPDYLNDIVTLQGKVSESTAPNQRDRHFGYSAEFVKVYHGLTGQYPNSVEKDTITDLGFEESASVKIWQQSIRQAVLNWSGNSKVPLARIIEVYQAGGTWAGWKAKTYPKDKPRSPTQEMTPERLAKYKEYEEM